MATFTTLPHPFPPCIVDTADSFDGVDCLPISLIQPRYRVVLAGKCFFHIEETSTGRVRGFRTDHNEACYLARRLESSA
ncbi:MULTISPECIES: hypothetical protein [Pseudomonas]|jgi:hypothetical protein|uniref:hypothetical protein n=1 Tax=Pseudomonas TaxID=286 RepID=UPI0005C2D5D2|nr:hypothetical protein F7R20_26075 [Pseudomonas brassicacearum subsp. brassicacearum]KIR17039.1 hypothetical protein PFLU4_21960 [Pseudomonas fluorescens]PJH86387.1 hypothetical protein CVG87_25330 [Pseudomonas sp. WCS365]QEO79320.1 hypothetical protein ELZ14_17805 [Pseudomonas brassicacearum]BBP53995.1 hypothetical protein PHLH3_36210 [Pseudomonas sp. St386]